MNFKALSLGALLGFAVAMSPSCGPTAAVCDATTCAIGCCDATSGQCVVATTSTQCGSGGNVCVSCPAGSTCSAGTCTAIPDAGPVDAGACGPHNHTGCCTASDIKLPGTVFTNCGSGGADCKPCAQGQACVDVDGNPNTFGGACQQPDAGPTVPYGIACASDGECVDAGIANGICKLQTNPGGAPYTGGYCTKLCPNGNSDCGNSGVCAAAPTGGEDDNICMDKCTSNAQCRSPGYACYTSIGVCWISPFPAFDAGVAPDNLIGSACTAEGDCEDNGNFKPGLCQPETVDGGATGWNGGYCLADCGGGAAVCGNTAICIGVTQTQAFCFDRCSAAGTGQSDCRPDYVCDNYFFPDGGSPADGFCWPNCNNPGWACAQGQTCGANGYCQ
jgi:hypothetical protein